MYIRGGGASSEASSWLIKLIDYWMTRRYIGSSSSSSPSSRVLYFPFFFSFSYSPIAEFSICPGSNSLVTSSLLVIHRGVGCP